MFTELPRFADHGVDRASPAGRRRPCPAGSSPSRSRVGDAVAAGQTLVVLEAMKVEHRITAADGIVAEVLVAPGDNVDAHQLLVRLEPTAHGRPH